MRYRDIIEEARVTSWGGGTFNVYRNPSKPAFDDLVERAPVLRGLLSRDGRTVWLWDASFAVHSNVMQELALGDYECISYNHYRKTWSQNVWNGYEYYPAIARLTPTPKHRIDPKLSAELDELLKDFAD